MKPYPEVLSFIRDMIIKYSSPLGLPLSTLGGWCRRDNQADSDENGSARILYSGGLHVTMAIIDRLRHFLPLLLKDPSKEARISALRKLTPLSKRMLSLLSWHSKLSEIPRKALEILHRLGYNDIKCLPQEPYNGSLLIEMGFKEDAIKYGETLRDFFKEWRVEELIVIDPHTFEMFTEFYPRHVKGFDFRVTLFYDILVRHLDDVNGLELSSPLRVTYHDPCIYSKRLSTPVISQPREMITHVKNLEFIEAFNHGKRSRCCGGPVELLFLELSKEISRNRLDHLKETDAQMLITSCPICYISFNRVKARRDDIEIVDLIDFIHEKLIIEKQLRDEM